MLAPEPRICARVEKATTLADLLPVVVSSSSNDLEATRSSIEYDVVSYSRDTMPHAKLSRALRNHHGWARQANALLMTKQMKHRLAHKPCEKGLPVSPWWKWRLLDKIMMPILIIPSF